MNEKSSCPVLRGRDSGNTVLLLDNLSGAKLRGANLSDANLRETKLSNADLSGADLSRAVVLGKELNKAQSLQGATMPDGSKHP